MSKADIYLDNAGRRRVDRDGTQKNSADPMVDVLARIVVLEAQVAQVKAENVALKSRFERLKITSGSTSIQISGQGENITISASGGGSLSGGVGAQFNNFEMCDDSVWALLGYKVS